MINRYDNKLRRLDRVMPNWRLEYNNDFAAAYEDLIGFDEAELAAPDELDFRDIEANWRRVYEDYDATAYD